MDLNLFRFINHRNFTDHEKDKLSVFKGLINNKIISEN